MNVLINIIISLIILITYLTLFIVFVFDVNSKSFNNSLKLLKLYICLHYLTIILCIVLWSPIFVQSILVFYYGTLFIFAFLGLEKSAYKKNFIKYHILICSILYAVLSVIISLLG